MLEPRQRYAPKPFDAPTRAALVRSIDAHRSECLGCSGGGSCPEKMALVEQLGELFPPDRRRRTRN